MDVFKTKSFWEKKKPFYKHNYFWIAVVAAIFIIILLISRNGSVMPAENTNSQSKESIDEVQLEYGEKAIVDGISYGIKKIEKEVVIPLGVKDKGTKVLTADGVFYIIRFQITNTGNGAVKMQTPKMWVVSEDYADYFAARTDLEARFKSTIENGEVLEPNKPVERIRFFDVSPGMKNLQLLIDMGKTRYYLPLSKQ